MPVMNSGAKYTTGVSSDGSYLSWTNLPINPSSTLVYKRGGFSIVSKNAESNNAEFKMYVFGGYTEVGVDEGVTTPHSYDTSNRIYVGKLSYNNNYGQFILDWSYATPLGYNNLNEKVIMFSWEASN